ncbi:MAG: hypothetical protein KGJ01_02470 [Patescibacteria group bacterium]|nr:hypothetical protein [Patescibacteria group bacterium]
MSWIDLQSGGAYAVASRGRISGISIIGSKNSLSAVWLPLAIDRDIIGAAAVSGIGRAFG